VGLEEQVPSGLLSTVEGLAGYFRKGSLWPALPSRAAGV